MAALPAKPLAAAIQITFPTVVTPYGIAALIALLAAADDLVRKTVTALRLGRDAGTFLSSQRREHLAAMKRLLELQASTDDVAARIVIDHAVEHLDADLRWLETAAVRVGSSTDDRKLRT